MEVKFRQLRADEIDCRISQISKKGTGLQLLLYKDARCDMNILDETVGPMNWQRKHGRDNANCVVSIYDSDKKMWVEKEDTGTESNTEAEKGLASDSFKRSCFNWGIGRELYTAPFIWVDSDKCKIGENGKDPKGNPKYVCYDRFEVIDIKYKDGKISDLSIWNTTQKCMAFDMNKSGGRKKDDPPKAPPPEKPEPPKPETPQFKCEVCGNVLVPYKGKDGKAVSLRAHAERSRNLYSQVLCIDCINKLNASQNS